MVLMKRMKESQVNLLNVVIVVVVIQTSQSKNLIILDGFQSQRQPEQPSLSELWLHSSFQKLHRSIQIHLKFYETAQIIHLLECQAPLPFKYKTVCPMMIDLVKVRVFFLLTYN